MLSGEEIDIKLAAAIDEQDLVAAKNYMAMREKSLGVVEAYNIPIRKGEFVGQLPLYVAVISNSEEGDHSKKFQMIDWLISKKANPDFKNSAKARSSCSAFNNTPLLGSAFWGEFETTRYFIDKRYIKNLYMDNLLPKLVFVVACRAEVTSEKRKEMLTYLVSKFSIDPFSNICVDDVMEENPLLIEVACESTELEQFADYVEVTKECGFEIDFEQQTTFQAPEWRIDQSPIQYSLPLLSQVLFRGSAKVARHLIVEMRLDPEKANEHGGKTAPIDAFSCRVGAFAKSKKDKLSEADEIFEIAAMLLDYPIFLNKKIADSQRNDESLLCFILEDLIAADDGVTSESYGRLLQTIFNKVHPKLKKWSYRTKETDDQVTVYFISKGRPSTEAEADLVFLKEADPLNEKAYSITSTSKGLCVIKISDIADFNWEGIEKLLLQNLRASNSSVPPAAASLTFLASRHSDEKQAHDARPDHNDFGLS